MPVAPPTSQDPTRLLSDATVLSVVVKIGVGELGTTRHTAGTFDQLAVDGVDDLPDRCAKLNQSRACDVGEFR